MMKINWHRLFGLMLMDYFTGRGFRVELEKDLSLKRQYLDVVILEQEEEKPDLSGICDGFDNLAVHNSLLSYKSKGGVPEYMGPGGVDRPLCELS
jgi:hypothetical protein